MGSSTGSYITKSTRAQMKVYAARDYIVITRRLDNYVEGTVHDNLPNTPQADTKNY